MPNFYICKLFRVYLSTREIKYLSVLLLLGLLFRIFKSSKNTIIEFTFNFLTFFFLILEMYNMFSINWCQTSRRFFPTFHCQSIFPETILRNQTMGKRIDWLQWVRSTRKHLSTGTQSSTSKTWFQSEVISWENWRI